MSKIRKLRIIEKFMFGLILLIFTGVVMALWNPQVPISVTGKVERPEMKLEKDISVNLGELKCGESFSFDKYWTNALVISNTTAVKLKINLTGLDEEINSGGFVDGNVNIVIGDHHTSPEEYWDEYFNVTIDLLNPIEQEVTLHDLPGNHDYDIRIIIQGTTGYPENGCDVDFSIVISAEPP